MAGTSDLASEVTARYNDLILQSGYFESTVESTRSPYLFYKTSPVLNVLRPIFLSKEDTEFVASAGTGVRAAIGKVFSALHTHPHLANELGLNTDDRALLELQHGYGTPDTMGRLDGFFQNDGSYKFVEYNSDSPAGIGQGDELTKLLLGSPIMKELAKSYVFSAESSKMHAYRALIGAYQRWGGNNACNIAILDKADVGSYRDFFIFKSYFESMGHQAQIVSPEELEIRGGHLWAGDFRIDLVYKRILIKEFLDCYGLNHPLVRAVKERLACVVNGFVSEIMNKKLVFSVLSDPRFRELFTERERQNISAHVPWTRRVAEGKTDYEGKEIDLVPFIAQNRELFVIKPNDSSGGDGVVVGSACDQSDWENHLKLALQSTPLFPQADVWLIQKKVDFAKEVFPIISDDALIFRDRFFDVNPYVWNGEFCAGYGARLSTSEILNIAGGSGSIGCVVTVSAKNSLTRS